MKPILDPDRDLKGATETFRRLLRRVERLRTRRTKAPVGDEGKRAGDKGEGDGRASQDSPSLVISTETTTALGGKHWFLLKT